MHHDYFHYSGYVAIVIIDDQVEIRNYSRLPNGVTPQVTTHVAAALQTASQAPQSREELQRAAGMRNREHFRKAYLEPLPVSIWLERTIPDKPQSRMQKYRLTENGRQSLREWTGGGR